MRAFSTVDKIFSHSLRILQNKKWLTLSGWNCLFNFLTITPTFVPILNILLQFSPNFRQLHSFTLMNLQACVPCHPECRTCQQSGPYECNGDCVHYVEDGRCVAICSPSHFATDDGRCLPCDVSCSNCTGSTSAHCTSCRHFTLYDDFANRHEPGATVRINSHCVLMTMIMTWQKALQLMLMRTRAGIEEEWNMELTD